MTRVVYSLVLAVLTAIGLVLPMSLFRDNSATTGSDPVTITDYRADYKVAADGTLTASETVTANFPSGRHGIFRFWDLSDPADTGVRYIPNDITVQLDGGPVPVDLRWETGRRFRVAKIGDANQFVAPGSHIYIISYNVKGVLAAGDSRAATNDSSSSWSGAGTSRFIWRVVADGWQMPIEHSETTVTLPAEPTAVTCRTSTSPADCQITRPTPTSVTVTTGPLAPATGVAVRTELPVAAPSRSTLPWPIALDPVLGRSVIALVILLLASLATFALGVFWVFRSRETAPLVPVMFEPPADPLRAGAALGPVQTYFVVNESAPSRGLVATLLHMAEQNLVKLDRTDSDDWTVTSIGSPDEWSKADPVSISVARALGLLTPGSQFDADGSVSAGKALSAAKSAVNTSAKESARTAGTVVGSPLEGVGRVLLFLAIVVSAILFIFKFLPFSVAVLPIAAFAVGSAGLAKRGVGTRRTKLGREVWSRAGGFERLLSTRSNQERLDFGARQDLYTSFIPYAIAFNCADAWADKYRTTMASEPPMPIWIPVPIGGTQGFLGSGGGFDSFESSLSSSLSAYSASQSSSSSSGGFSGGFSGGGGGGGGSW